MLGANTKSFKSYGKNKTNVRSKIITTNWANSSESDSSPAPIPIKSSKARVVDRLKKLVESSEEEDDDDEKEEEEVVERIKSKLKLKTVRELKLVELKEKRKASVIVGNRGGRRVVDQENVNSPIKSSKTIKEVKTSIESSLKGKNKELPVIEIIKTPPKSKLINKLKEVDLNSPLIKRNDLAPKRLLPITTSRSTSTSKTSAITASTNKKKLLVHSDELDTVIVPKAVNKLTSRKKKSIEIIEVEVPKPQVEILVLEDEDDDEDCIIMEPSSTSQSQSQSQSKSTFIEPSQEESQESYRSPVLPSAFSFPKLLLPLLKFTNQTHALNFNSFISNPPSPFSTSLSPLDAEGGEEGGRWKKIGEASYSEVFESKSEIGENLVIKIIPVKTPGIIIGSDKEDDVDYPMISEWESVLREMEITDLVGGGEKRLEGFVEFKGAFVVQGKYPKKLLNSWDEFKLNQFPIDDEQIRPNTLPSNQIFVIIVLINGGKDLENFKISSWREGLMIFKQVVKICSLAEKAIEFEHRDLHIGNILIQKINPLLSLNKGFSKLSLGTRNSLTRNNKLKVKELTVELKITLIDFTLSRVTNKIDGKIFFDNFNDEELFDGDGVEDGGDYQFDIYRLMKSETNQDWKSFHPKTNLIWLHYLLKKLLESKFPIRRISSSSTSSSSSILSPTKRTTPPKWATSLMLVHPTTNTNRKSITVTVGGRKKRNSSGSNNNNGGNKELKSEIEAREKMLEMELFLRDLVEGLGSDWKRKRGGGFVWSKKQKKVGIDDEGDEGRMSSAGDFCEVWF